MRINGINDLHPGVSAHNNRRRVSSGVLAAGFWSRCSYYHIKGGARAPATMQSVPSFRGRAVLTSTPAACIFFCAQSVRNV